MTEEKKVPLNSYSIYQRPWLFCLLMLCLSIDIDAAESVDYLYTIQLMGTTDYNAVQKVIREHPQYKDLLWSETQKNGQPWHTLINGMYKTKDKAKRAYAELPATLKIDTPQFRKIGSVIESLTYSDELEDWLDSSQQAKKPEKKISNDAWQPEQKKIANAETKEIKPLQNITVKYHPSVKKSEDGSFYTIQLLGSENYNKIQKILSDHPGYKDLFWFEDQKKDKEWHTLIHGMYASKEEAKEAYTQLPDSLKFGDPWIKKVNSVIDDVAYNDDMTRWLELSNDFPKPTQKSMPKSDAFQPLQQQAANIQRQLADKKSAKQKIKTIAKTIDKRKSPKQKINKKDPDAELTVDVDSFYIDGESPVSKKVMETVLRPYTGLSKTVDDIQDAADALMKKFREAGYGFYQVALSPQSLDNKQVELSVKPLKIDKVSIKRGNKDKQYYSQDNIRKSIPSLKENTSPNIREVTKEIKIANLNRAKNSNVEFSISDKPDMIDAEIVVNETRPHNFYAWFNKTGTEATGLYRTGIGYKNSNLFDKDHELTVSYTTSPDHLEEVKQYGANYRIPFYQLHGLLQFNAYYSDVDSGKVAGGFDVSGKGRFMGAHYEWYLPEIPNANQYNHHLTVGLEDKLFDNDISFQNTPFGSQVRSTPLSIAYHGKLKDFSQEKSQNLNFFAKYSTNLEAGDSNDDKAYNTSRFDSKADWSKFNIGVNHNWIKNGYRLSTDIKAQYTDQELIPGEQFSMGGSNGQVRGFNEGEVMGDRGIKGSVELWSPPILKQKLNLLAFADAGYADKVNPLPDELASDTIMSVGLGAQWQIKDFANLAVHAAHVIDGNDSKTIEDPTESGDNKIHFNVFMDY